MSFKEHIKDTYSWPQILEEEIKRISDTLRSHLRTMGVKMNVEERRQFVKKGRVLLLEVMTGIAGMSLGT